MADSLMTFRLEFERGDLMDWATLFIPITAKNVEFLRERKESLKDRETLSESVGSDDIEGLGLEGVKITNWIIEDVISENEKLFYDGNYGVINVDDRCAMELETPSFLQCKVTKNKKGEFLVEWKADTSDTPFWMNIPLDLNDVLEKMGSHLGETNG